MTAEPATTSAREWYADGLQFECTMCGNCCTGPPGYVLFTPEEGRTMAKLLGLDESTFLRRFARKLGRKWSLRERRTEHGLDCVFLNRERLPGKAVCSIYAARPTQCRTWPFWPDNLRTPAAWEKTREHTPCPGMGQGSVVPVEEIRIRRDRTPKG